jgi:hypothetical protein
MGSWGIKALESDSGLDVIDFLEDFYYGKTKITLSEIITEFQKEGFLSSDFEDIEFLYDNTAMSLAELYLMFKEAGELNYDNEDEKKSLRNKKSFDADKKSILFILRYLTDIKNEKKDEEGIREFTELMKKSDYWEESKNHLDFLITKLNKEKTKVQ